MNGIEFQRFSSAYDQVRVTVTPAATDVPQISRALVEDLWYWTADRAKRVTDSIFVRFPEDDGHYHPEPVTDVALDELALPEKYCRDLGVREPQEQMVWIARPGHAEQLERFYV
jgi:hypothetical protein